MIDLEAAVRVPTSAAVFMNDLLLVEALRRDDEAAFVTLVDQYHSSLVRLALIYVRDHAVAEEVVQETWLGVLRGLSRFQGRSSLKTWIFRILTNRAKTRALRERRSIPFSAIWDRPPGDPDADPAEPAVEPERFLPADHPLWPHHWATPPQSWEDIPEDRLLSQETRAYIERAIEALPPNQRAVITLRDMEGWTSEEICTALEITEANQRVLLHRARSKVRRALEQYFSA